MTDQPPNPYAAPGPDDRGRYAPPPPPPTAGPGDGSGASPYGQGGYAPSSGEETAGPPPYGQPYPPQGTYGSYAAPAAAQGQLAGWGARVGARLLDGLLELGPILIGMAGLVVLIMGSPSDGSTTDLETGRTVVTGVAREGNPTMMAVGALLGLVGYVLALVVWIWNRVIRQGRTGQSWGKKVLGLRLVDETTGGPTGAGKCFLRELAHYFDGLLLDLGFLWPLWDAKRQTFADKLCTTVVTTDPR